MVTFQDETEKNDVRMKEMREKEAEDLAQILAKKYKLPYLDLSRIAIELDALKLVPEGKARAAGLAVFQKTGNKLEVAIQSPNPEETKLAVKELEQKDFKPNLYMVSDSSLDRVWKRYAEVPEYTSASKGIVEVSSERLAEFMEKAKNVEDLKIFFAETDSPKKKRNVSETLERILAGAIASGSSDIHIEPQEDQVRLRYRLDGVLHDIFNIDYKAYKLLLSRLKLISGLKLNIHDQAQDGRFSIDLGEKEIEIRASIVPENYGESFVLRILDPDTVADKLEDLGMRPEFLAVLNKELEKPNGMILTTGPTGSGKTSTLYAALRKIYNPEIKIITLEDPVEYHLKGIIQTQVEKDYGFADGLRAVLRQDPDVILVGEIRDAETAKVAINAALTGHLVLSTLHTNDAAGTISRLIDLEVSPTTIAPAVNFTMAQRLVRKLCDKCKEKYSPSDKEKTLLEEVFATFPKKQKLPKIEDVVLWKAKGCVDCNSIGYKKRIGIFEGILVNEKIEKLIVKKPTISEILEASKEQEILNMKQDGILKVLEGATSLDELQRVVEF